MTRFQGWLEPSAWGAPGYIGLACPPCGRVAGAAERKDLREGRSGQEGDQR
jgi:hypothetical protein